MNNQSLRSSRCRFVWLFVNLIVLAVVLLLPPWKIVHYERWIGMESLQKGEMRSDPISGTWGPMRWAPVWIPPQSFSSDRNAFNTVEVIDSPVRWPWMEAKPGYAAEIDHTRLVATLSLIVVLNSVLMILTGWATGQEKSRKWSQVLAAFGGGQMLGWFGFGLLGAASMGFAWQPVTFYGSLGAGLLASCIYVAFVSRRTTSAHVDKTRNGTTNQSDQASNRSESAAKAIAPSFSGSSFTGFVLAMPISFLMFVVATRFGKLFMGRSIDPSPLGGIREHELLVNYITGITLLVVGCYVGWWISKKKWGRGFGYGLICCSVIAGALTFFQH